MNLLAILTALLAAIHEIEAVNPDAPGPAKMDAAIASTAKVVGNIEAIRPQLAAIIDATVTILNETGVFRK